MSLAKQLQDFITASLEVGMGWERGSVWNRVVELQNIQAGQLEKAFQLNMKLAQLTGKQEYLQKAADIAEKASRLDLALNKEVREAYANFAKEIRKGNINFNKQLSFGQEQGRAYVDLRGANLKDVNITIAEKINEVKNAVHTLQEGKDFGKDKADLKEQKVDLKEQKDKAEKAEQKDKVEQKQTEQKAEQKAEKVEQKQAEQKQAEQKEQKAEFQRFVEGTKGIQPEKTELKDFKQDQAKGQEQRGQDRVEQSKQEQAKGQDRQGQDKQEQAKGQDKQEQVKETGQDKELKPDLGLGR